MLLPTRERSKKFIRLLNSINETCMFKERLNLLLLIDEDDKEINLYEEIIKKSNYNDLNIKIYIKTLEIILIVSIFILTLNLTLRILK